MCEIVNACHESRVAWYSCENDLLCAWKRAKDIIKTANVLSPNVTQSIAYRRTHHAAFYDDWYSLVPSADR
jgi:hypothetical protein